MIKTKTDTDFSETTRQVYRILSSKYGYSIRVSNIWELLAVSLEIPEFEILEPKLYQNGQFESYLIDQYISWRQGNPIDFSKIASSILEVGDFTGSEKLLLSQEELENRLWAIYLCLIDPNLNL